MDSKRIAGLAKKDFDSNKEVWGEYNFFTKKLPESNYKRLLLIKIGEPFKSGIYPGEFVPYEIKLTNGTIKSHVLALRNDNPGKEWMVDGGL